jgi:hypothetical protein
MAPQSYACTLIQHINNVGSGDQFPLMIMETGSIMLVTGFGSLAVGSPFGAEVGRIYLPFQGHFSGNFQAKRQMRL